MSTEELVARLRAAMDETERIALAASEGPWTVGEDDCGWAILGQPTSTSRYDLDLGRRVAVPIAAKSIVGPGYEGGGVTHRADAEHIARHDPASVLADVAADRRILGLWEASRERDETMRRATGSAPLVAATGAYQAVVEVLAQAHGVTVEDSADAPPP